MIYIGIDPGMSGAIAIVRPHGAEVHKFTSWAFHHKQLVGVIWDTSKSDQVQDFPTPEHGEIFCVIEQGQAMPGQGVKSTFSFGVNCGGWACLLETVGIPREFVHPLKWKRTMGLVKPKQKSDKALSIKRACELFPALTGAIGRNHNKAEALLLAEYARRVRG